jgi:hypothetical protein
MDSNPTRWIAALRHSRDQLPTLIQSLSPEQLRHASTYSEWIVSQVLSHPGSGSELGLLTLQAGLEEAEAPSRETSIEDWDRRNAMSAEEHTSGNLDWDSRNAEAWESLSPDGLRA